MTLFADLKDFSVEHIKTMAARPTQHEGRVRMPGAQPIDAAAKIRRLRMTPCAGSIRS